MTTTIKLTLCIFALILSVFSINAITITSGTFFAEGSNTSLSVSEAITIGNSSVGSNFIYLEDFQFNNTKEFWVSTTDFINSSETYDLNYTRENTAINTSNFVHYFRFNLTSTGTLLTNWTFNGFSTLTDEIAIFFTNIEPEGTKNWLFEKFGYATSYFGFEFDYSTYNNITFNATPATISINIRDKTTLEIINTSTFNIELVGDVGLTTNTSTGTTNISNIFLNSGEYRLVVSSPDYFSEDVFFNFTNEEVIELDVYMTNINESNAGVVTISVVDGLGQAIPGAIVQALQWDGDVSQFIRVSEGQTGLDGRATLNVILEDKVYIFRGTKNGLSADSPEYRLLVTDNGKVITIPLESAVGERTYLFRNLIYNITEVSFINNVSTINFDWVDQNGISQIICLNVYRYIGLSEKMISTSCTSGVSGSYLQAFEINTSNNIKIKGEVKIGNAYYTLKTFNYPADSSLPSVISFLKFEFLIIPVLFLLAVALGIKMESMHIGFFMLAVASGISLYLVPTLITGGIVAFLDFMSILMIWGAVGGRR